MNSSDCFQELFESDRKSTFFLITNSTFSFWGDFLRFPAKLCNLLIKLQIFINSGVCCSEAVVRRYSLKKVFLEILQNSQESTCAKVSFLQPQACNFIIKNETLAQVFSCEFCEIFLQSTSGGCFCTVAYIIVCITVK